MRFSHETPKNLLQISRFFNDFDYALDIKFDDKEYYNFFKKSIELGREVWLDNSLYERRITGVLFDEEKYVEYIEDLSPTYYIVPDTYESSKANIKLFEDWNRKYNLKLINHKKIVVIHGNSYEDYVKCYQYFDTHIREDDIIAFSGGDTFMKDISRANVIKKMFIESIINTKRKHHLLGSLYPSEFIEFQIPGLEFIDSMDTSLPIVCTYENKILEDTKEKPKSIIHNIFNEDIEWNMELLYKNINFMRYK